MKRPDISLATIAGALALLGTTAVVASCAKSAPAESATTEPARVATPSATAASAQTITASPVLLSAPANASGTLGDAGGTPGRADDLQRKPTARPTGMASCGAGTCTADPKKKK